MLVDVFVVVTVACVSPVDVAGVTLELLLDEVGTDSEEFKVVEEVDGEEDGSSVVAAAEVVDRLTGILFELDEELADD